jgi:tetratricopeptide (TPR) repeat protein
MLFTWPKPIRLTVLTWVFVLGTSATSWASPPGTLLNRADSLREDGKLVQAITLYRTALTEALTGCERSRAYLGLADIHWNSGNALEAQPHLTEAVQTCGTCPTHVRTELVLELAQLLVACGKSSESLFLLEQELKLGPLESRAAEVQLAVVELHFVEGHWERVWEESSRLEGARAGGLRLQAGAMLGHPLEHLPVDGYLSTSQPNERSVVLSELTHLHTSLSGSGRLTEALDLARKLATLSDPVANREEWTVAQLRVAVSAERAGQPLEALLAYHEAGLAAQRVNDDALRARIAREQARFERDRGATEMAFRHLALADSLTQSMLYNVHKGRDTRSFQSFPVLNDDPFELAAAKAMKSNGTPGAWPFACALLVLGLLAASLRANELKKALRTERVRAFRMQRMMHAEADPFGASEEATSEFQVTEQGEVEEVLTRPDRLDFDDVIASLEMDHGTAVEWEFDGTQEGREAPDGLLSLLSVTVKRLLEGNPSSSSFSGRIRNDWQGIQVEIEGPETPSTIELQRMFAGGTHSSKWNPVLVQIEKLAGRFTVEKRPTGELALTFLLPHVKS